MKLLSKMLFRIHILFLFSALTITNTSFAMGAKQAQINQTSSTVINRALPLIENLLPLFSSVTPMGGTLIPLLSTIINIAHSKTPVTTSAQIPTTSSGTFGGAYLSQITDLAEASSCAAHIWKNGNQAPIGFIKGMAVSFGRSVCRQMNSQSNSNSALENLRSTYLMGIGKGILDNNGNICLGWKTPTTTSSIVKTFLSRLLSEYKGGNSARCLVDIFSEGTTCPTGSTFDKACPAFGVESAMSVLRTVGTLASNKTNQAEIVPECNDLLQEVQAVISQDLENACGDIN